MKSIIACALMFFAAVVFAGNARIGDPLVSGNFYLDIAYAGDRVVAVGDRGKIILSDDDGKTWHEAQSPASVLLTAVCFTNQAIGWAVGHDATVLGTRDGGLTWQVQYLDELNRSDDGSEDDSYDDYGDDGGYDDIYAYDDFEVDTSGAPLLDVWCRNEQQAMAVGGFGYLVRTSDGGNNWMQDKSSLDNPDGWHLYAISAIDGEPDNVFIAGERGTLMRSKDRGESWETLESPYHGSFFGITSADPATLLVHGLQGNVWLSRDRGDNWQQVPTGLSSGVNNGTVLTDGTIVLTGNAGAVLTSRNQGGMFSVRHLPDRQTISSVLARKSGGVFIAGVGGVRIINEVR